jgi:hypothetical protein
MARLAGLWYGLEPVTPLEPAGAREMRLRKAMGNNAWGLAEKALAELRAKRKPFSFSRDELLLVRKTYLKSADYTDYADFRARPCGGGGIKTAVY